MIAIPAQRFTKVIAPMAWLTWEAKRLGDPDIYLGESFAEFMEKLGLSYHTGGGCRGDAARLRKQMRRLFHCLITFRYEPA